MKNVTIRPLTDQDLGNSCNVGVGDKADACRLPARWMLCVQYMNCATQTRFCDAHLTELHAATSSILLGGAK